MGQLAHRSDTGGVRGSPRPDPAPRRARLPILPAPVPEAMRDLDDGVATALETLANRLERLPAGRLPDLARRLSALEALVPAGAPTLATYDGAIGVRVAERDHTAIARGLVREVAALEESIDSALAVRPR
jgi:hypothetical protein